MYIQYRSECTYSIYYIGLNVHTVYIGLNVHTRVQNKG